MSKSDYYDDGYPTKKTVDRWSAQSRSRWTPPYARSPSEHGMHYAALKRAEAQVQREKGENDKLGVASLWGPTPRAGAYWGNLENDELVSLFRDKIPENGTKLGVRAIAELAWELGRSANATETQLKKLIGFREFYTYFEFSNVESHTRHHLS